MRPPPIIPIIPIIPITPNASNAPNTKKRKKMIILNSQLSTLNFFYYLYAKY